MFRSKETCRRCYYSTCHSAANLLGTEAIKALLWGLPPPALNRPCKEPCSIRVGSRLCRSLPASTMPTGGSGLQQFSSNKMELPSGRCFCLTQRDQIWWEPETWHCLQFPTSKHFFFQANFGSYIYPRLSVMFPVQQELSLLEVLWLPGLTGPPPLWAIYIKILRKLLRMAFSVFKNLESIESQPRRCSPIFSFSCLIRKGYMIMCLKKKFLM